MSKMKITNVKDSDGNKLVVVDSGWNSNLINEKNLNWYGDILPTGEVVNDNPVFIVDKNFKKAAEDDDGGYLMDVKTFDIIKSNVETRKVVDVTDLEHRLLEYKYNSGKTIPKDELKKIIHSIQYKEVIK